MDERATVKESVTTIDKLVPGVYSKYTKMKARQFARYGLTPPQTAILLLLYQRGAMRVSDIASATEMVDSNVSNICSRLQKMGFVQRNRPEDNRRVVQVELTDAAREKLAAIKADQVHFAKKMGRHVSREDLRQIEAGLEGMNRLLDMVLAEE